MKKINSINYGSRVIIVGLIFLVAIPSIFFVINQFLQNKIFTYVSYISIIVGVTIEILFFVHLIIELRQDKKIYKYCQNHKKVKIILNDGKYECGYCSNRNVRESDTECNICGIKFETDKFKTVQDILNS
jgi:hypothetical protein